VLAKIAEMPEPDRAMAERLHALLKASAPALSPSTWYGMPAYKANLDEGAMWPTSFALKELTAAERQGSALVKKAVT
jgi:hypothetical protein